MIRSPYPDVEVPDVAFTDHVLRRAGELGNKPALIDGPSGRTISYAQLARDIRTVAAALCKLGFGRGDVFAHYAPNLPEYAVTFHAVATLGAVNTTVNPLFTADELAAQLSDCRASLLVTVAPLLDKAMDAAQRAGVEQVFVYGEAPSGTTPYAELLSEPGEPPHVEIDPASDLVALPYSSGTTGLPKGVMLTHRNLVANIAQIWDLHSIGERDRTVAVLPFFHIYGLIPILNAGLAKGVTIVTMPRFELPDFLRTLQEHRITRAYVVPPIALALAKHPLVDEYDLSSLEFVLSGAAPLGAELQTALHERLGVHVLQGYGMTETSPVTHIVADDDADNAPGSVGRLVASTECRIVDLLTQEDVPTGETGELLIRGPQVMRGYLGNPEATAHTLDDDGWLHTGDVGRVDENERFWIVDRVKELIKYKGYQIAPAELEAVLIAHPQVREAAVIPVPDEEAGEVPKAFVAAEEGLSVEDVMAFVAERVAPYKKLRAVEIVDEIPKSPSGKLLRRLLIQRERERAGAAARAR